MATHSSILAWEIPWTEEPGGLQTMGWQRVEYNLATEQQVSFWPPQWLSTERIHAQCRRHGRSLGFDPSVEKIPWRRKWQPTPVFLPGESHGQRRLAGYGSWGSKEDTAEQLSNKRKPNNFSLSTRVHRAASPARQQARPWALGAGPRVTGILAAWPDLGLLDTQLCHPGAGHPGSRTRFCLGHRGPCRSRLVQHRRSPGRRRSCSDSSSTVSIIRTSEEMPSKP